MKLRLMVPCVVLALVLGCSGAPPLAEVPAEIPAAIPAEPVDGALAAMEAQHGWADVPRYSWLWADDASTPATTDLVAPTGARGIQIVTLPPGVTSAMLQSVWVGYSAPGEAQWSVYAVGADGEPTGEALSEMPPFTVEAAQVASKGSKPVWTRIDYGDGPTVPPTFALVFKTVSGAPAVGGFDAQGGAVRFQDAGAATSRVVPYKAHVRVQVQAY